MSLFLENLAEHASLARAMENLNQEVLLAGALASRALKRGGKILLCGNGGSAADCQHFAAELTGRFIKDRRPLAALALTTDTSALTSIANDYAFDEIFSRQVMALGHTGDLLICISTSGNSTNVIHAIEQANNLGIQTLGLLGNDGGRIRHMCGTSVVVPSTVTARIQEYHILIVHTLCGIIEQELGHL